ncbi:MAG: hypothetical protein R2790_02345 [Flavobacterium haoranii]
MSKKLTGCLIVVAGLGNTSFVGFPVIEALFGKKGIEQQLLSINQVHLWLWLH